jgi:hypothetical protein
MGEPFWVVFGAGNPPEAYHIEFDTNKHVDLRKDNIFKADVELGIDRLDVVDRLRLLERQGPTPITPHGDPDTLMAWARYIVPPGVPKIDYGSRIMHVAMFRIVEFGKTRVV